MQFPGRGDQYGVKILTRHHALVVGIALRVEFRFGASRCDDEVLRPRCVGRVDVAQGRHFNVLHGKKNAQ